MRLYLCLDVISDLHLRRVDNVKELKSQKDNDKTT